MSASLTPRELVIGVLVRAGAAGVLPTLVDASLHRAVVRAVGERSVVAVDPSLLGNRPDALTGRRVPALDEALRGLARDGALQWQGSGWSLRSRERKAFLAVAVRLTQEETVALDALSQCWRRLVAAEAAVVRTASSAAV